MKGIRVLTQGRRVQLMITTEDGSRYVSLRKDEAALLADALSRVSYNVYGEPKHHNVTMLEMEVAE